MTKPHRLATIILLSNLLLLSGCGFQLRTSDVSYQRPSSHDLKTNLSAYTNRTVFVEMNNDRTANAVKQPLIEQLTALNVSVNPKNTSLLKNSESQVTHLKIDNIRLRKYDLLGVLTEVRLVILADVTYQVNNQGKLTTTKQPLQIERSYQYNEASVSSEDQQGQQTKNWLYQALASRITDQYIALTILK